MRKLALAATILTIAALTALPVLAGEVNGTYLDGFTSQTYGGNDGTLEFNGAWIEVGEADGPTSGNVWVWDHEYCDGEFCLKMGGEDEEAEGRGVYRAVDLAGATSAKLRVDYGRELLDDESEGTAVIQVSPDGGDTWLTLKTISLDKDDGGLLTDNTFEIDEWATADTRIRFMITEAEGLKAYWLIDNVTVEVAFETTTKPTTTTTTTTKPTTTTTVTVQTTTTTKPRVTTTTTKPHKNTESEPTTTTSTVPRTTTAIPTTTSTTLPPDPRDALPPEEHDMMMDKTSLAVTSAMPPTAMPAALSGDASTLTSRAQPVEMIATAFFTESGSYGGNILPAIVLGVVIAVVSLLGVSSRKRD